MEELAAEQNKMKEEEETGPTTTVFGLGGELALKQGNLSKKHQQRLRKKMAKQQEEEESQK